MQQAHDGVHNHRDGCQLSGMVGGINQDARAFCRGVFRAKSVVNRDRGLLKQYALRRCECKTPYRVSLVCFADLNWLGNFRKILSYLI